MPVTFTRQGTLRPGTIWLTWQEIDRVFGWTAHRRQLLEGLKRALGDLKVAGCQTAYIDGSFVTTKERPNDFDACWDRTGVDLRRLLNTRLWTFDRGRPTQKGVYGGELLPADAQADIANRRFLDFFQIDKESGKLKGIVANDLRSLP
ncbi:MAG: hypothetical protein H0W59_03585 [Chloroflexia bacterium]|jgi:hypothetical protein|nr:hypothetical protein [Chloroflexia bacterium]